LMQNLLQQQQATQRLLAQHARLEQQARSYQDPYVIESEAREQLGYARPGEHVVVVVGPQNQSRSPASATTHSAPPRGFWQAWWNLFFGNG